MNYLPLNLTLSAPLSAWFPCGYRITPSKELRPELSYDRGKRGSGPLLIVTEIANAKCKQITALVTFFFLKFLTGLIKRTTKIKLLLYRLSALDGLIIPHLCQLVLWDLAQDFLILFQHQ